MDSGGGGNVPGEGFKNRDPVLPKGKVFAKNFLNSLLKKSLSGRAFKNFKCKARKRFKVEA